MITDVINDPTIRVLEAAIEGLALLERGWRRGGKGCSLDEYAPDVVRYFLRNWRSLAAAAEGVSASGANPIGGRGDPDARRTLVTIKADLESATDQALEPLIRWQSVARIYKRQSRFKRYIELRATALLNLHHPEPYAPLAEAVCIERIARQLGWVEHEICEGAS